MPDHAAAPEQAAEPQQACSADELTIRTTLLLAAIDSATGRMQR
jgi:hypothetical protein